MSETRSSEVIHPKAVQQQVRHRGSKNSVAQELETSALYSIFLTFLEVRPLCFLDVLLGVVLVLHC